MKSQTKRILALLLENEGREVSSLALHRAGSGKDNGWCNSLSRRISDVRALGYTVPAPRIETVDGQKHTFYTLIKSI